MPRHQYATIASYLLSLYFNGNLNELRSDTINVIDLKHLTPSRFITLLLNALKCEKFILVPLVYTYTSLVSQK